MFPFSSSSGSFFFEIIPIQTRNLVDLKLSGNPWKCDCSSLGWIRDWLKDVKSKSVFSPSVMMMSTINYGNSNGNNIFLGNNNSSVSGEEEGGEERIERVLSHLREAECSNRNRRSLLEAFRKELRDCRRNSSTYTLALSSSDFLPLFSILVLTLLRVQQELTT